MELEAKRYEELAHKLQEHEQQITEHGELITEHGEQITEHRELITEQGEQIKGNTQYEFILLWLFSGEVPLQVPRMNEIPNNYGHSN